MVQLLYPSDRRRGVLRADTVLQTVHAGHCLNGPGGLCDWRFPYSVDNKPIAAFALDYSSGWPALPSVPAIRIVIIGFSNKH